MRNTIAYGDGVRLWHNHPSQDSLSHHDWLCAGSSEDLEVLVLNQRGSIFVGRIAEWDERLHGLLEWLPRLAADLELRMSDLARKRELEPDFQVELSKFTGHILNLALAECTTARYGHCLLDQDQIVIQRCASMGITQDGQTFAVAEINEWLASAPPPPPTDDQNRPSEIDELDDQNTVFRETWWGCQNHPLR